MPRNIVICCDGTANEFKTDRTNVVKLYYALALNDPARQIAYYHPGLGTMEASAALTSIARWITRVLGKAFGYGLSADIRDAYVYLMNATDTITVETDRYGYGNFIGYPAKIPYLSGWSSTRIGAVTLERPIFAGNSTAFREAISTAASCQCTIPIARKPIKARSLREIATARGGFEDGNLLAPNGVYARERTRGRKKWIKHGLGRLRKTPRSRRARR
jgi:hypothetical protein